MSIRSVTGAVHIRQSSSLDAHEQINTENEQEFQRFVITRMTNLLYGQKRIEHLLASLARQDSARQDSTKAESGSQDEKISLPDTSFDEDSARHSQNLPDALDHHQSAGNSRNMNRISSMILPTDWPRSLKLRKDDPITIDIRESVEEKAKSMMNFLGRDSSIRGSVRHSTRRITSDVEGEAFPDSQQRLKKPAFFLIHPTHKIRLVLDFLSVICLFYELVTIPYFLAWNIEVEGSMKYIQISATTFWTVDMISTFQTGYILDGHLVYDAKKIAKRYLARTFVLDFTIIFVDWVNFFSEVGNRGRTGTGTQGTAKVLRMGKFSRALRLARIVHLEKLSDLFEKVFDLHNSKRMILFIEFVKLFFVIGLINHILGCIFFAISNYLPSDTGARWLDLEAGDVRYADSSSLFQYATAYHWSLTQMTPGSMQVHAQNSVERIFTISCVLFGVVFFSSLISRLSAKMVEYKALGRDQDMKMATMMRFLRERNVSWKMTYLMKQQVTERMRTQRPLLQQNVSALNLISGKLQAELHTYLCNPCFSKHPLHTSMSRLDRETFNEVCFHAMNFVALDRHDILFNNGALCNDAYIISRGSLAYSQRIEGFGLLPTREVHELTWLCEAALWSQWIHVGNAECAAMLEVLKINADELFDRSSKNKVFRHLLSDFGRGYHKHLVSLPMSKLPSDLCDDTIHRLQVLSTVSNDVQQLISTLSLTILRESWFWRVLKGNNFARLHEEVLDGRATLLPISDEHVRRYVNVSCLKLSRSDGCTLVELATSKITQSKKINLPGTKLRRGEDSEDALTRILNKDLTTLQSAIRVGACERKTKIEPSSKFLIETEYTRHVYEAELVPVTEGLELPSLLTNSQPLSASVSSCQGKTTFFTVEDPLSDEVKIYAWMSPEFDDAFAFDPDTIDVNSLLQNADLSEAVAFPVVRPQSVEFLEVLPEEVELVPRDVPAERTQRPLCQALVTGSNA